MLINLAKTGWDIIQGYANSVGGSDEQSSNQGYNLAYLAVTNHFADVRSDHTTAINKCFINMLDTIRHNEASREINIEQARTQLDLFLDNMMVSRLCSPLSIN